VKQLFWLALAAWTLGATEPRYHIEPFLSRSIHTITGSVGEAWKSSPSFGGGVRFPVAHIPMNLAATFEIGEIAGIDTLPDFFSVNTSIAVEYEYFRKRFRLIGGAGIANVLISAENGFEITKPFAGESENEFGVALYLEPSYRWNKLFTGIRIQDRYIVSSPDPLNLISLSLIAGVRF